MFGGAESPQVKSLRTGHIVFADDGVKEEPCASRWAAAAAAQGTDNSRVLTCVIAETIPTDFPGVLGFS